MASNKVSKVFIFFEYTFIPGLLLLLPKAGGGGGVLVYKITNIKYINII
jgi:hypothetical protein